ncbi:MAG: glycosyltransferase family 39 protein [Anaerolineaceae bacterium]|nr:glycosyltransferase family 39 protein [Anaerolineaceae bacterium]
MKTRARIIAIILTLLFLFSGLILVSMSVTNFENARAMIDQLSPDGNMESFTMGLYEIIRVPSLVVGSAMFVLGGVGTIFFDPFTRLIRWYLRWIRKFIKEVKSDFIQFLRLLFARQFLWWEWMLLAVLIAFAFYGRWVWIERPMLHDESYTFIAFAQRSFDKVISDYHLPNNHVLNSVLIHILYRFFGNFSPAVVRLPAFISGILIVPAAYLWVREKEGKTAAAASAALIAYWPLLKVQSTNGRGYMMMALLTISMFGLGEIVRRKKNRAAWGVLVLITAANFYTLPIALYPFAIFGLWLFFVGVMGDISDEYGSFWRFFKYFAFYGAASGILTFLLYTPIFLIGSGWNSFFNNPFVSSLNWYSFTQSLPVRLMETARDWMQGVPSFLFVVLVTGIFLNLALHWKRKRPGIPLLFCIITALTVIFLVQRPNPWSRVWTYLLPIMLIMGVVGWFDLLKSIKPSSCSQERVSLYLSLGLVVIILIFGVLHIRKNMKYAYGELGQEETVTLLLQKELKETDMVVTPIGFGPAFWYYFDYHQLPMDAIMNLQKKGDWERAFLLVDDRENESYLDLLERNPIVPGESGDCPEKVVSEFFVYGHYSVMLCERQVEK